MDGAWGERWIGLRCRFMRAAILAVGSELLGTERLDTNSLALTRELERFGVRLGRKVVVGDDLEELEAVLRELFAAADLVLVTGGLGPTADDLTRQAVAATLGRGLVESAEIVADIQAKFASFGMRMPEVNRRQAEVIEGAEVLTNRRGTAPGQRVDHEGGTLFLFPGVPHELEAMVKRALAPWLERHSGRPPLEMRLLKVACVPESTAEEMLAPAYQEFGAEAIALLASAGELQVRLTARGGAAADGGLVAERLTRVPGSSAWFVGSAVTYSNRLKREMLGVAGDLIERHGAVSREVAQAMAGGVRARLGSDYGLAITGIAGPDGGSDEKPVGTVHVALAGPADGGPAHRHLRLPGDRARVRRLTSQWALDLLRRALMGDGTDGAG